MPTQKTYHYTESGLTDVWIEGLHTRDDAGDETIIIPGIRRLHKLIAHHIVTSDGALTGPELKFLRSEMGMTQAQLGKLVHRTRLTISRCENDERKLDGATEAFIRILAASKLKLSKIDPEEISDKCGHVNESKDPIRIDATHSGRYRLVA